MIIFGLREPISVAPLGARCNVGSMVVERLAEKHGGKKLRPGSSVKEVMYDHFLVDGRDGLSTWMFSPMTTQDKTGPLVKQSLATWHFSTSQLVVVYDDVDFKIGKFKIVAKGGSGGHPGVKSIIDTLKTEDFIRIKIGVGSVPKSINREQYVRSLFGDDELEEVLHAIEQAVNAIDIMGQGGLRAAQIKFNSTQPPEAKESKSKGTAESSPDPKPTPTKAKITRTGKAVKPSIIRRGKAAIEELRKMDLISGAEDYYSGLV